MTAPDPGHDFSVLAQEDRILYCTRCAKPDLNAIKTAPCMALPEAEARRRIEHKIALGEGIRPTGRRQT